jgi:hypothetical protein
MAVLVEAKYQKSPLSNIDAAAIQQHGRKQHFQAKNCESAPSKPNPSLCSCLMTQYPFLYSDSVISELNMCSCYQAAMLQTVQMRGLTSINRCVSMDVWMLGCVFQGCFHRCVA